MPCLCVAGELADAEEGDWEGEEGGGGLGYAFDWVDGQFELGKQVIFGLKKGEAEKAY